MREVSKEFVFVKEFDSVIAGLKQLKEDGMLPNLLCVWIDTLGRTVWFSKLGLYNLVQNLAIINPSA